MLKIKQRILKAAFKRGNKLTQSELTRYVTRINKEEKEKAIKELEKDGYIEVVITKQLDKTGCNPTYYYLTAIGVAIAS